MNYWLDLYTGTTWDEYRRSGARVTGFRERMRKAATKVKPGDIFLCYLTGVMRWVGALEVIGPSDDRSRIFSQDFPVRFEVRPLLLLEPEHGVPMQDLQGRVDFFKSPKDAGKFKGFVRMSPNLFRRPEDGELILNLLHEAQSRPVSRPVDPRKLARKPLYKVVRRTGTKRSRAVVSVPEPEEPLVLTAAPIEVEPPGAPNHTEIQYYLLRLGGEMGLDVWVARNDRSKIWNGTGLGTMRNVIDELPSQFNEATNRTIELIDVLWLKGNTIIAAFEVESTTSIYSGLLRMSDLLALQPNITMDLYLVAPDDRRSKVEQEILRPTFNLRERPLAEACGFLPFSKLLLAVEGIRKLGLASSLKPDFLKKTAEYFTPKSEV